MVETRRGGLSFTGGAAEVGEVVPLVDVGVPLGFQRYFYDVAPDGRFLVAMPADTNRGAGLTLLQNWPERLRSTP